MPTRKVQGILSSWLNYILNYILGNNIAIIAYMLGSDVNSHNCFIYVTLFTHLWARNPIPAPKPTICQ